MLASYLSKNLGATVIVENRPGAGGLVALSGVYMAPSDGLTITRRNAMSIVTSVTPEQRKRVRDILARAR
jgi:tripartite-type tricarboxylate transporter receptor subunit TctC